MTNRTVLSPHAGHPITIERNPNRIVIEVGGNVVADTRHALTLREANYPPVQYIPTTDIDMAQLRRSDHASYCPYKGDAGYFDVLAFGDASTNVAWSYDAPFDAVREIIGHLAFYPDRVSISEHARAAAP